MAFAVKVRKDALGVVTLVLELGKFIGVVCYLMCVGRVYQGLTIVWHVWRVNKTIFELVPVHFSKEGMLLYLDYI